MVIAPVSAMVAWGDEPLPGTAALEVSGDLSMEVVDRVDRWFLSETARRQEVLAQTASRTPEDIQRLRDRLRRILGLTKDLRIADPEGEFVGSLHTPFVAAENGRVRVLAFRWPALEGVEGEGLLLEPLRGAVANVIALPDADQSPELIAGVGTAAAELDFAWARRLAEGGCRVVIPTLLDRRNDFSGNPRVAQTNQSHREWVSRQAYYLGRHVAGYEIHKVLAAADVLQSMGQTGGTAPPLILAGYGEGGWIALLTAAVDQRFSRLLVSGAWGPLADVWQQPIDRNVWSLVRDFRAADLLDLAAATHVVVEAGRWPEVTGPRGPHPGNQAATGRLTTPSRESVAAEWAVWEALPRTSPQRKARLLVEEASRAASIGEVALRELVRGVPEFEMPAAIQTLPDQRRSEPSRWDPRERMRRQVTQLVEHVQRQARLATFRRGEYWSRADASTLDRWRETTASYRQQFRQEILGESPAASVPMNPRTRVIYETPAFVGYEVVLDLWPEVHTYGILLVPRGIPEGERRPVVVAQHGRAGRPQEICDPREDNRYYHGFGARLAEQGWIVYAPQNLYLGEEKYRQLQRKGIALGQTFFAPMVRMHERVLEWLGELPFVDRDRIGFYGLSYGGKSAMLLPAAIPQYALSMCSGDFNEEVWKHTSLEHRFSFQFTNEHDHSEFDTADTFNYAEIAGLIAPRPFLVERGHSDGVGIDEWVAYEFARVKRRYLQLGVPDNAELRYFVGGHEINLPLTQSFLEKHLPVRPARVE
jgi:dienelactone hydrolase